jgi:GTPase SAR1 family protein
MQAYDYLFKVIFLGEASSGKSSIFERLVEKTFASPYHVFYTAIATD